MFLGLLLRRAGSQVAQPTSFAAATTSSTNIRLTWTAGGGGLQTEVWRNGSLLTTVAAGTSLYDDGALTDGIEYTYQIRHKSGSNYSSFTVSITRSGTPPAPVLTNANVVTDDVTVFWNAVATATQYRIYRTTTSGSGYSLIGTVSAGTLNYADNNLANGTYYYVVRAYNGVIESANSNEGAAVISYAPPITDPSGFTATASHPDRVALAWTNGDATAQTEVYRGTSPNPTSLLTTLSAGVNSYNDDAVSQSTHYYYRIRHKKVTSFSNYVSDDDTTLTATLSGVSLSIDEMAGTVSVSWTVNNPPVSVRIDKGAYSDSAGLQSGSAATSIGASPNQLASGYTFVAKGTPGSVSATGTLAYLRLRNTAGTLFDEVTNPDVSFDAMDIA